MATVKRLQGTEVYEIGTYGQYAGDKRGQQFSKKKVITDAFNTGYGSHWVNRDDTGNSWRLVLDGVKANHVAKRTPEGYELPANLSLTPVGDVL